METNRRRLYYRHDENYQPIPVDTVEAWAQWYELFRFQLQDKIGDFLISTIFLGIDHDFRAEADAPILWETMVFDADGKPVSCRRCSTYDEAMVWHLTAVMEIN